MSMSALPLQITVTIEPVACGNCGVWFGVEAKMLAGRRKDGENFWCPRGCKIHYGEFENAQLQRQLQAKERALQAERDANARARQQRDHYERSARTYRGHLTRVRKRIGNGVCPCCQRTFTNLARHMQGQHPHYAEPVK